MESELPYRFTLLLLTAANLGLRCYFGGRAGTACPAAAREEKESFALKLLMLPWIIAPVLYIAHPPLVGWAALPLPDWVRWLGGVWGVLCVLLLGWIHHALGANFSSRLQIRPGHCLVRHGPYRWVRHPMYLAAVLAWIAAGLLAANWFIAFGAIVFLFYSMRRIPKEEVLLLEAFGAEYRAYQRQSGALVPKLLRRRDLNNNGYF